VFGFVKGVSRVGRFWGRDQGGGAQRGVGNGEIAKKREVSLQYRASVKKRLHQEEKKEIARQNQTNTPACRAH